MVCFAAIVGEDESKRLSVNWIAERPDAKSLVIIMASGAEIVAEIDPVDRQSNEDEAEQSVVFHASLSLDELRQVAPDAEIEEVVKVGLVERDDRRSGLVEVVK